MKCMFAGWVLYRFVQQFSGVWVQPSDTYVGGQLSVIGTKNNGEFAYHQDWWPCMEQGGEGRDHLICCESLRRETKKNWMWLYWYWPCWYNIPSWFRGWWICYMCLFSWILVAWIVMLNWLMNIDKTRTCISMNETTFVRMKTHMIKIFHT